MASRSSPSQYGSVAVTLHWLSALLVVVAYASGLASDEAAEADRITVLTVHASAASTVVLLTLLRIAWWWFADKKPEPTIQTPAWQDFIARAIHGLFYVVIVFMAVSGYAMLLLTGAPSILLAGVGQLPNFESLIFREPHEFGSSLMVALLVVHAAAAFYHQLVMKDALLSRMWFARRRS